MRPSSASVSPASITPRGATGIGRNAYPSGPGTGWGGGSRSSARALVAGAQVFAEPGGAQGTYSEHMSDDCRHGMNPAWCSSCLGDDDRAFPGLNGSGTRAGVSEQEQVDRLCRQLGVPSQPVGEGVQLPLDVLQ